MKTPNLDNLIAIFDYAKPPPWRRLEGIEHRYAVPKNDLFELAKEAIQMKRKIAELECRIVDREATMRDNAIENCR